MGGELPEPGRNAQTDPLNLSDFGYDVTGNEVHSDGEIWVAVQYDVRDLLLDRYKAKGPKLDVDCARGRVAVASCPGDRRWMQLYYDAMVLMPRNATILQARDAMLASDMTRFGGADLDLLWQAYAQRGFGQFASVSSNGDPDPVPDFSSPLGAKRHAHLRRSRYGREPAACRGEDLRRRLPGPGHPGRRYRPRDERAEPRRNRAVRTAGGLGSWHQGPALRLLQLRRERPRVRPRPLQRQEPEGGRDAQSDDQVPGERCLVGAGGRREWPGDSARRSHRRRRGDQLGRYRPAPVEDGKVVVNLAQGNPVTIKRVNVFFFFFFFKKKKIFFLRSAECREQPIHGASLVRPRSLHSGRRCRQPDLRRDHRARLEADPALR